MITILEKKYPHLIAAVRQTPWAILPEKLLQITELLRLRCEGVSFTIEQIRERIGAEHVERETPRGGSIAILPLFGIISHRMNLISESSGGTSIEKFTSNFRQLVRDPSIGSIIIDVDSPGGGVSGVEELSAEIFAARETKRIVAVANSLAASAAFWIGSAAGEFVVTPSGEVGSIGVIAIHEDFSVAEEKFGIKTTFITAGKFKAEGNSSEPLSDEARENIQERVDAYYDVFVKNVARNRGVPLATVKKDFGEGRVVGAKQALESGMVDRVATLDQTIERVSRTKAQVGKSRAQSINLEMRRRRLNLRVAS